MVDLCHLCQAPARVPPATSALVAAIPHHDRRVVGEPFDLVVELHELLCRAEPARTKKTKPQRDINYKEINYSGPKGGSISTTWRVASPRTSSKVMHHGARRM